MINPSSYADYRPTSILPFLFKVLMWLVYNQLNDFFTKNTMLASLKNPLQSGFRPGHRTPTDLIKITDDIRAGMDNQWITLLKLLN